MSLSAKKLQNLLKSPNLAILIQILNLLFMRRIFVSLLALIAVFYLVPSAANAQQGLKIGFSALPQTTWLLNKDEMDLPVDEFKYKTTFGMAAGPFMGYNFSDKFGFRLGFLYSVQGQNHSSVDDSVTVNSFRKLHYLKMPLTIGLNSGTEFNKVIFFFHAGFQVSLLTSARHYDDDERYTPDELLNPNITDYPSTWETYKWWSYGPVVQTGIDVKLAYNVMANLHLRADYSLGDIENKDATYRLTTNGITNVVGYWPENRAVSNFITGGIMLGVTYTFTPY